MSQYRRSYKIYPRERENRKRERQTTCLHVFKTKADDKKIKGGSVCKLFRSEVTELDKKKVDGSSKRFINQLEAKVVSRDSSH